MKIVVTGALGHIGSALIRALPERFDSAEILMIDNLSTLRYPSLFDLPATGRYRFVEADVRRAELRPLFEGAHSVVHLAATTDAEGSVNNRSTHFTTTGLKPSSAASERFSAHRKECAFIPRSINSAGRPSCASR